MFTVCFCLIAVAFVILPISSEYTVTIFPQILSQNGRTRFEPDRWNSHNGLDGYSFIAGNNVIGSRAGRWLNPDLNNHIFSNATEDPNRKGYPDPSYFNNPAVQKSLCSLYLANLAGYENNRNIVMETKGQFWPKWMNTSQHGGVFPNNLDAAAEMMVLLVDTVYSYTNGNIPAYFEVINEPDSLYKYIHWDTVIHFHKIVAQKLHANYQHLKVGGPTETGIIGYLDQKDFSAWHSVRDFMNMSLIHMDFLSFHPYSAFTSPGSTHLYQFNGVNEARLVAVIDLVESYSNFIQGKPVPIITSEYGLSPVKVDPQTPTSVIQWAYIFLHNSQMFTYLNHRGVMEQAVAFLLSRDAGVSPDASIFYQNGSETHVAKAYRFWKSFTPADQFLRVDSEYNGGDRMVSPLAVFHPDSHTVKVLLHNYARETGVVRLNFSQSWMRPTSALSTCIFLGGNKEPVFLTNQKVHFMNNVYIPPESTCFYAFYTSYNPDNMSIVNEETVYSRDTVIPIQNNIAQSQISLPNVNNLAYVKVRFAVSNSDKTAQTKPSTVTINGLLTSNVFTLYDSNREAASTLWEVYTYEVLTSTLRSGSNLIKLQFAQTGGYVSGLVMLVGSTVG